MESICGILAPNHLSGHKDEYGCLKKHAHIDNHVFKDQNGKLISWEEDFSCECGCWDKYDAGDPDVCVLYIEVHSI